jgi:MraZ protein
MANFLGEFECKIDVKGRILLPSNLKKQLSPAAEEKFVVNRGFEKHLVLYPMNEWKIISEQVNKLNLYVKKNRDFIRRFHNGATELELDNTSRLLIPKPLQEYAGIDRDVVLFAFANRIEVWAKAEYDRMMNEDSGDFASLAEEVMGKPSKGGEGDELS